MPHFPYGQAEMDYLADRDPQLGAAIARLGFIAREVRPDPFAALVWSVVSQQISSKAAQTVCGRLSERLTGDVTPARIAAAGIADIQQCGMSLRKAGYLKGLGAAVTSGQLEIAHFATLPDAEIIRQVSALHGLGIWTAEMLLIFSLCRPDVVSWGDLAIRRGMTALYGLPALGREQFQAYRARYSPHGSVASLYLWAISAE